MILELDYGLAVFKNVDFDWIELFQWKNLRPFANQSTFTPLSYIFYISEHSLPYSEW